MTRMDISHRAAFELLQQGLDLAHRQAGARQSLYLRAAVLAALDPEQRSTLQDHWAGCPACRGDLALTGRLRSEAEARWSNALAPRRSAAAVVEAAARPARRGVLRPALGLLLLAGALAALFWTLDSLRPQPASITPLPAILTPAAQLTPTPDPRLEALPQVEITPFAQGRSLEAGGWSPGGRYLAFSQATGGEPAAPGDLASDRVFTTYQFFDRESGQVCAAGEPQLGSFPAPGHTTWLADESLLVATRNEVFLLRPCDPQAESLTGLFAEQVRFTTPNRDPRPQAVLAGENAYWIYDAETGEARRLGEPTPTDGEDGRVFWSPSGLQFAISQPDPAGAGSLISLVEAATGRRTETIPLAVGSAGFAPWLDWLLEEVLYVYGGPDGGSLLLRQEAGGWSQTQVMPEIYGSDAEPSGSQIYRAEGAVGDPGEGVYHLFLAGQSPGGELVVYHSEDGRVERRPLAEASLLVFPGGEALSMFQLDGMPDGVDFIEVVHIDKTEAGPQTLHAAGHRPRGYPQLAVAWLPQQGRIAFGSSQGVSLLDAGSGEPLAWWRFRGVEAPLGYVGLTPNAEETGLLGYAIIEGGQEGSHSALYYLPLQP